MGVRRSNYPTVIVYAVQTFIVSWNREILDSAMTDALVSQDHFSQISKSLHSDIADMVGIQACRPVNRVCFGEARFLVSFSFLLITVPIFMWC